MGPVVSVELSVLPVAVLWRELMESLQELVMQHQGLGLQLISGNSQLRTGVNKFAGLHEVQKHKRIQKWGMSFLWQCVVICY